jgi:predicted lipoprotein with Yx(FWY)xxD motif
MRLGGKKPLDSEKPGTDSRSICSRRRQPQQTGGNQMDYFTAGMDIVHTLSRRRTGKTVSADVTSWVARVPMPVRLGVPLAAALLAGACSSGTSSTAGTKAAVGSASAAGASPAATSTVITTESASGSKFLITETGHAVYLWAKDGKNSSACTGACASAWPPVPATGKVTATGGAVSRDLGSITRSDGTKQVTYDGHPLYFFAGDSGPGQANGQGSDNFGAKWWLVAPSGADVTGGITSFTKSGSSSQAPSSPGSAGSNAGGGWT